MAIWSLKGKKILVVDDFAEMRSTLRTMLESYGANDITSAGTGEEAIDLLCAKNFDIVLCDYNLGEGKDGQQVLEEVKHRNKLPYAGVFIMVTAENTTAMVMGALEYQPDDYLSKPFARTVLQSRLKRQLDKKEGLIPLSQALEQGNSQRAIALCDALIKNNVSNRLELLKLKTDLLINEKLYDQAEAVCQAVLAERSLPWANFCLGKIRFLQGDFQQAKQQFEIVLNDNAAFISAYDWLARCYRQLDDHAAAQQTLLNAVEWSPKSVLRQRALAEVAEQNEDFTIAERARRRALRTGKNSILREPGDYTGLAQVLVRNDNGKEALRTIERLHHEFSHDSQARLAAALTKSKVYESMGEEEACTRAMNEALAAYENTGGQLDKKLALELTQACLQHDKTEIANRVVSQLANNNHDDPSLLEDIDVIYKQDDSQNSDLSFVDEIRKQVTTINNNGVRLLEAGNTDEAIALFEEALKNGPANQVLNINTAQSYLMKMKQQGYNPELAQKARSCLDKTAGNKKLDERYRMLNAAYWKLINRTG